MSKTCPVCGGEYADSNAFCPNDGSTLLATKPSGDLVGSVIADRYRVERLLGQGGMGQVYLARHVRLPQQAAIKVMHTASARDEAAVARFNREAANAARIEHERVARVFDFGEWGDGVVYLAMEYVPGRTLRAILEDEGRLSPARAANITYQVAEGLDAAHRLGIVHRDLKPDNIMVVTDDQGVDRCKVVDFGIAKANDASGTKLTSTGMIVGTPEFMSPEQIVGDPIDARTDVYALALTAFQMFTGSIPFTGATPERVLMARLMQEPATLAATAPEAEWPEALQAAFTGALASDAANRTASALEFAEAVVGSVEQWTGTPVLRGRTPMGMSAIAARTPTPTPTTPMSGAMATEVRGEVDARATSSVTSSGASSAPSVATGATAAAPRAGGAGRILLGVVGVAAVAFAAWRFSAGSTPPPAAVSSEPGAVTAGAPPGTASPSAPALVGDTSGAQTTDRREPRAPTAAQNPVTAPAVSPPPSPPAAGRDSAPSPAPPATRTGAGGTSAALPASAVAARRELDAIRQQLASESSGEAEARAAIPQLQRVLRDLGTAADSTWAYLALVSALGQAGEGQRACNFLRSARRLATTDAQLRAVQNFFNSEALACVP